MYFSIYKGYSLRVKLFIGFMIVCFMSIVGSSLMSYAVSKSTAEIQSRKDMYRKVDALMSSLDYAVSDSLIVGEDLPVVLKNKIHEIADINRNDVIIYDVDGNYLVSNKDYSLVEQKRAPDEVVKRIKNTQERVDIEYFDVKLDRNVTSSYMLLRNNMLEPIAIVYFPFYHNNTVYFDVINEYFKLIIPVNIILIIISAWISWEISKGLTKNIRSISDKITRINLLGKDVTTIKYYNNDELTPLVDSYNKMIHTIEEQRQLLLYREKEEAWREMAKQVAHEVKNPLTPMKLLVQNFVRKFDRNDPNLEDKVQKLSKAMIDQIDVIAAVAGAFSQFTELPKRNDEVFNVNNEVKSIIRIFNGNNEIFFHANKEEILIRFDKIYFSRILTNLITNAQQALDESKKPIINVDLECYGKKFTLSVRDNGVGIPKDKIDRIFEPNFTTKSGGMGLGLSMVKRMVEDYNGEISVKSEVGKGTEFVVTLPICSSLWVAPGAKI